MHERLASGDALSGFPSQHASEEISTKRVKALDHLSEVLGAPLGESRLEIRERGDTGPGLFVGRTEDLENLEDLINFRVTSEEGHAADHFSEDATNRPDVDGCRVALAAEENLRRTVPQGDDFVSICANRSAEGTSKTEIGKFQDTITIDEEVLGLQITVEDTVGVAVGYTLEELEEVGLEGEFKEMNR